MVSFSALTLLVWSQALKIVPEMTYVLNGTLSQYTTTTTTTTTAI